MISDAARETPSKLDRVSWLRKRHYIDERAAWAADLLLKDHEAIDRTVVASISGPKAPQPNLPNPGMAHKRLAAKQRIEAARSALGPDLCEILTLVVLRNLALPDAAAAMGIHPKAAIPLVRAGLQVLVGLYLKQGRP